VSDWKSLDLSDPNGSDWRTAVEIFSNRIYGRFLAPVESIIKNPDHQIQEFSGFVVVAIDCLLIETLNQFYNGLDQTTGSGSDAFWDFFQGSRHFKKHFDTKQKANIFYSHFRCGILHQAQTKKLSKIRIGMSTMVQPNATGKLQQGLIVDRQRFHQALLDEIEDYKERLENPTSQAGLDLRKNFIRKMSYIAK